MKIIAMKERSAGNGEVGEMWIDTAIFEPTATLADVLLWAAEERVFPLEETALRRRATQHGRLMLSIADEPKGD